MDIKYSYIAVSHQFRNGKSKKTVIQASKIRSYPCTPMVSAWTWFRITLRIYTASTPLRHSLEWLARLIRWSRSGRIGH